VTSIIRGIPVVNQSIKNHTNNNYFYIWTKIKNLDEISDEIGDFGLTKNGILDNIFLVSLIIR